MPSRVDPRSRQAVALTLRELTGPELASALQTATRAAGSVVKKAAEARAPVGERAHVTYKGRLVSPGFARRHVRLAVSRNKARTLFTALVGVASEAFYALSFLEKGTRFIPRRPWLVPAYEATTAKQLQAFTDGLNKALARIARKRSAQ